MGSSIFTACVWTDIIRSKAAETAAAAAHAKRFALKSLTAWTTQ